MTCYVLDTDTCSHVIRARDRSLLEVMEDKARAGDDLSISGVTYAEMRLGAEQSRDPKRHHAVIGAFCERSSGILAWDRAAADEFASLQARLLAAGNPIGSSDAMIAAHALSLGRVLVTNNVKHFSRVPGLRVENWVS